jgi:ketosteroid isomerase-like protein
MPLTTLLLLFAALSPAEAIRQVLTDQQNAWNRGDIDTYMQGYNNSEETLFIGKALSKGYNSVRDGYHQRYSTSAAMGKLQFTDLEIKPLDKSHGIVTGHFHLTRTAEGGGDAHGIFSLVFEREPSGWKIILDHTS